MNDVFPINIKFLQKKYSGVITEENILDAIDKVVYGYFELDRHTIDHIIERIKDIFYENIAEDEKKNILSFNNGENIEDKERSIIKNLVSLSIIEKEEEDKLVIFIPTTSSVVKKHILEFIKNNGKISIDKICMRKLNNYIKVDLND